MSWHFDETTYPSLRPAIRQRLTKLPSLIDGFLVDHIVDSRHYAISVAGKPAGYCSIHAQSLITQFYLEPPFSRLSQHLFAAALKLEQVRMAFVPTCDEYFLAHALDRYRRLEMQAYFFGLDPACRRPVPKTGFSLRRADSSDADRLYHHTGDFFAENDLPRWLANGQVRIAQASGVDVGVGLLIPSRLFDGVVDVGMYTFEAYRRMGNGASIVGALVDECLANSLTVTAGCWYYNHYSKMTLERAGLHCSTRLLRIHY